MQDKWRNTNLNVSLYWPEFLALPPQNGLCGPCLLLLILRLSVGFLGRLRYYDFLRCFFFFAVF